MAEKKSDDLMMYDETDPKELIARVKRRTETARKNTEILNRDEVNQHAKKLLEEAGETPDEKYLYLWQAAQMIPEVFTLDSPKWNRELRDRIAEMWTYGPVTQQTILLGLNLTPEEYYESEREENADTLLQTKTLEDLQWQIAEFLMANLPTFEMYD